MTLDLTGPEIIQISTAIGTLTGVVMNIIVSSRNSAKADVITAQVNSHTTELKATIAVLRAENESLKHILMEAEKAARILAITQQSSIIPTTDAK